MLTIPLRQFQLKASEYLTKLPITLTVYGKPVAIVNTFDPVEMVSGATEVTRGVLTTKELHKMVEKLEATEPEPHPPGDYLWDDHNLMPVYKVGEDDQFCSVWHQKGLRLRVYDIKKFRPDGSLEVEGRFCRSCIEGFLKQDGHLE